MSRMQGYLASKFDGQAWGENGPLAITRVTFDMCGVDDASRVTAEKCLGLTVLPPSAFYAIPYWAWLDIFDQSKTNQVLEELDLSYALHMWGRFSAAHDSSAKTSSAYDVIATKSCPVSYSLMMID